MDVPAFRANYAATRLQGVVTMLQDAESCDDIANALAHLDTVFNETVREAGSCGIFHR